LLQTAWNNSALSDRKYFDATTSPTNLYSLWFGVIHCVLSWYYPSSRPTTSPASSCISPCAPLMYLITHTFKHSCTILRPTLLERSLTQCQITRLRHCVLRTESLSTRNNLCCFSQQLHQNLLHDKDMRNDTHATIPFQASEMLSSCSHHNHPHHTIAS
jgi:hypothetical protein